MIYGVPSSPNFTMIINIVNVVEKKLKRNNVIFFCAFDKVGLGYKIFNGLLKIHDKYSYTLQCE